MANTHENTEEADMFSLFYGAKATKKKLMESVTKKTFGKTSIVHGGAYLCRTKFNN